MKWFIVFFLLSILGGTAGFIFWLYQRFRATPQRQWAERVLAHAARLEARLRITKRGPALPRDEARRRENYFQAYLKTISYQAVFGYPGIGQGTVDRLRDWGFRDLAGMIRYDFTQLPGIGPAKHREITTAVEDLYEQAQSRFDAGACPQGRAYQVDFAQARAAREAEAQALERETKAIQQALRSMDDLIQLANQVTFWRHVIKNEPVPGLDEFVMLRTLPEPVLPAIPLPPVAPPSPPVVVAQATLQTTTSGTGPARFPPVGVSSSSSLPTTSPTMPRLDATTLDSQIPSPPREYLRTPADIFAQELQRSTVTEKPTSVPSADLISLSKLRAFCGFLYMVAKSDSRLARAEVAQIRSALGDFFGHDGNLARHIDPTMERTEQAIPQEQPAVEAVLNCASERDLKSLYKYAERVADATGGRNDREAECLTRVAKAFGIHQASTMSETAAAVPPVALAPSAVTAPPRPVPTPVPTRAPVRTRDPREVLEIEPSTALSVDLIRRRYLGLWEKADPVRAASFGPEFVKLAEEKRESLRAAAEELIAPFGEPLDPPKPTQSTELRENPMLDDVFGV